MREREAWCSLIAAVIDRARRDLDLIEDPTDNHYVRKNRADALRDGGHPREFLENLDRFDPR